MWDGRKSNFHARMLGPPESGTRPAIRRHMTHEAASRSPAPDARNMVPTAVGAADASTVRRPGVPLESDPAPHETSHWDAPTAQRSDITVFTRAGGPGLTPVFGTAQPPSRISGAIRAFAYRIPEIRARHWMLLLAADRVDQWEHRLIGMARGDLAAYRSTARSFAAHPLRTGVMLGAGLLLVRRLFAR